MLHYDAGIRRQTWTQENRTKHRGQGSLPLCTEQQKQGRKQSKEKTEMSNLDWKNSILKAQEIKSRNLMIQLRI
jgi:hypothetical protein